MKKTSLTAPVPGMSLTAEPGSRPWRKPPEMSTVDEAVEFYMPLFEDDTFNTLLIEQAEKGVPLTSLSEILITANVMEGKHSIDVGVLVSPILVEAMLTIAEGAGVKAKVGNESEFFEDASNDEEIIKRAIKNRKKKSMMVETPEEPMEKEEISKGLMARRSAE